MTGGAWILQKRAVPGILAALWSNRIVDCIGVTGTAEGSRCYRAGHPGHSYLGRVCNQQQRGGEGKLQPRRRHGGSVDPGKRSTPTSSSARLRSCNWMVASQSHFVLAQVAIPMGSMMIRVRLTQA